MADHLVVRMPQISLFDDDAVAGAFMASASSTCATPSRPTKAETESARKQEAAERIRESISRGSISKADLARSFPMAYTLHNEPLDFIRTSQAAFWERVSQRLQTLCEEMGVPFSSPRPPADVADKKRFYERVSCEPLSPSIFLYDQKDLFHELSGIQNTNYAFEGVVLHSPEAGAEQSVWAVSAQPWGIVKVALETKTLRQYRELLADFDPTNEQIGIDDVIVGGTCDAFMAQKRAAAEQVLLSHQSARARAYCRTGCTRAQRGDLWHLALFGAGPFGASAGPTEVTSALFSRLQQRVFDQQLLTDLLLVGEVASICNYDDCFFMFPEQLRMCLLVLSRDTDLHRLYPPGFMPPVVQARTVTGETVPFPPSGVTPFRGIGYFAAPLCFVYTDDVKLYSMFRAMYTQYFYNLHTVSSAPQGLLRLCLLFETLLQRHYSPLFQHLQSLGFVPMTVVLPWITHAFAGFLEAEQVLLLWDRIIGFDTLDILPLAALSIFSFRQAALFQASTLVAAQKALSDIKALRIISLLQSCLFVEKDKI